MPEEALPAYAALTLAAEARRNIELHAHILAWIPDAVNIVSVADGRMLYNNPAFEAMYGYGPGELIGQTPDILNAPEGGPPKATAAGIIRALESSGVWRGELLNRRKDGSTFWTHTTITSQEQPQVGRVWLAIQRDITERKEAEEALRESQTTLRNFYDSSPLMMGIAELVDGKTVAVSGNLAIANFLARQVDELVGKTGRELGGSAEFDNLWVEHYQRSQREGGPVRFECEYPQPDGGHAWLSATVALIGPGPNANPRFSFVVEDVTERKRAVQALSASEALLRTITENSPDEIFFLDRRHHIEYLNSAGLELVRRLLRQPNASLEDLIGRPLWALLGDNDLTRTLRDLDQRTMTSGEASCVEDVIDVGGNTRTRLTLRAPIRDSRGEVTGLVVIARDITSRKHEELQRLASLEQQRDTLVREVHHRIKNHLHGVLGLLRMETNVHPDLAPHLSEVCNQIKAIAGVYGLQCANDAAGADLDRVVRLIVASAAGPVAYQCQAGKPPVLGDGDAVPVALVVNELITNALKHRTVADPARPARVTLERAGEDTLLNICAGPARLPADFDYAARQGLGIGLELITTLLPSQGVNLAFFQDGDEVRAELRLAAPLFLQ